MPSPQIIYEQKVKKVFTCQIPVTKEMWDEILLDPKITTPERLKTLLAFYFSENKQNTCIAVAKKYGDSFGKYNADVMWFGKCVVEKLGTFVIKNINGSDSYWLVAMCEGYPVKGEEGTFKWKLRPELVESLRDYIFKDILRKYQDAFDEQWAKENYKWLALKTFQDNWDIDAPDFASMLEKSLSDTKNLLVSQSAFPRLMITSYAKQDSVSVKNMFIALFDESMGVEERIDTFMKESDTLAARLSPGKMHYQNTNAISTYLWLHYPSKYCIYKWSEFNNICKKTGLDNCPKANGNPSEVIKGYAINRFLQEVIEKDDALVALYHYKITFSNESHYLPNGLATLAGDLGFWISRDYTPLISELSESDSEKQEFVQEPQVLTYNVPELDNAEQRFWWLVASPKYWSFSNLKTGETVDYTVKNDKGNKRRIPANFEAAREGDIVIGYEANPVKKIVALAKVVKASDGETITFEKTETLESPIAWATFKDLDGLKDMEFIKNQNGSFFKLTPEEYNIVLDLIRQENPDPDDSDFIKRKEDIETYGKEEFLNEVYMTEQNLDEFVELLRLKKNVILQGAPGVGKTFSAKRLAYYMMGKKDENCIEMVQFHQNYSYEDFIMGYRPTSEGGFELRTGVFYNFCKKAETQPNKEFFFIIDEINRGNLSKIFGELLMLIENSYRGHPIKLAYRNELFSVPDNLYIIGMMNTADRSLAMIDYALRRRFSFLPMTPGFSTDGFKAELGKQSDQRVAKVVEAVVALNKVIEKDDSLGNGFCIGHSYFCEHPADKQWIDHVVRYDICPMLDEYWFDSKEKCKAEKARLLDLLKS